MTIIEIQPEELVSLDLRQAAERQGYYGTAYLFTHPALRNRGEVYTYEGGTYGVCTGGDTEWLDADDVEQAIAILLG